MMPQMEGRGRRLIEIRPLPPWDGYNSWCMGVPAMRTATALVTAVVAVAVTGCHSAQMKTAPPLVQPGAPGESSRVIAKEKAVDLSQVRHTADDVRFMQGMIGHHAQALEMTALLQSRTASADMRMLAKRIEVSQSDEIKMMQHWLEARGQKQPDPHAHHGPGATLMPGMLTPEEMARLA